MYLNAKKTDEINSQQRILCIYTHMLTQKLLFGFKEKKGSQEKQISNRV